MKVPIEEPPAIKFCLTELGGIDNLAVYSKGSFNSWQDAVNAARNLLTISSSVTRSNFGVVVGREVPGFTFHVPMNSRYVRSS